jgi:hypothetical protein
MSTRHVRRILFGVVANDFKVNMEVVVGHHWVIHDLYYVAVLRWSPEPRYEEENVIYENVI